MYEIDPPGTWLSRSSEFSVVYSTKIALNIAYRINAYFMNRETTGKVIVYARNTAS